MFPSETSATKSRFFPASLARYKTPGRRSNRNQYTRDRSTPGANVRTIRFSLTLMPVSHGGCWSDPCSTSMDPTVEPDARSSSRSLCFRALLLLAGLDRNNSMPRSTKGKPERKLLTEFMLDDYL